MTYYNDERGNLGVIDDRDIPFKIKRVFWITNVPANATRGNHAHRDCEQVIICLLGSFVATVDGQVYQMTNDSGHVLAATGSYIQLSAFSPNAVCLVLCSEYYSASDVYQS
jgi:hypothetical protein